MFGDERLRPCLSSPAFGTRRYASIARPIGLNRFRKCVQHPAVITKHDQLAGLICRHEHGRSEPSQQKREAGRVEAAKRFAGRRIGVGRLVFCVHVDSQGLGTADLVEASRGAKIMSARRTNARPAGRNSSRSTNDPARTPAGLPPVLCTSLHEPSSCR